RARRRGRPLQHAPDGGGRAPVRPRGAARRGPRGRRRDARGAGGRRGPDAGPAARHRAAAAARVARGHRGRDARRVLRRRDDGQGGGHGHRAGDPRRRTPRRRRRPRDGARPPEPRRCVLRAHWPRAPRRGHAGRRLRLMLTGLVAALGKDLRLLARDRVGLVFLTVAPIVVISVAGLSLATLYGAEPRGGTAPVLPVADEDGGWVGRAVRERLADEPSVRVRPVATAAAARARFVHAAADLHRALDDLGARLEAMRADAERRRAAAERELRAALAERQAAARARLAAALAPLRAFLAELAAKRQAFAEW